ncbi:MAG: glycosyltransferase [Bacteroidia bacterium]|nr:glycosyltransferase [Bacteroidia bacterium]MCX7763361.1 glycosyltransferase [Bacteroidia bacterium]MDW8056860.1 glycosyltransferase [Bacteroidia bacterium]
MQVWEWLFWSCVALLLYPYVLYPAGVLLVSWIKRKITPSPLPLLTTYPEVTIVIPAYREAGSVVPKMESIRQLEYPKDKIRVLWVIATHEGDESFAPTLEALRAYPEAEVLIVEHRGKIHSLNEARGRVKTEYVLISDADVLLSSTSLLQAIRRAESDPRIAIVGGRRCIGSSGKEVPTGQNEGMYVRFDALLGAAEGTWGYALGLWGGFLLMKQNFWSLMPSGVVDDLYLNLDAILQGGKVVIEPTAKSYELPSPDISTEFRRKVRIAYTAFHTIAAIPLWKRIWKVPTFAFFFLSHKLFRYLIAPIALVGLWGSTIFLAVEYPYSLYGVMLVGQGIAWIEALILLRYPALRLPFGTGMPGYFVLAHVAQLVGLWRFLRQEDPVKVWQRLPRVELQPSASDVKV